MTFFWLVKITQEWCSKAVFCKEINALIEIFQLLTLPYVASGIDIDLARFFRITLIGGQK